VVLTLVFLSLGLLANFMRVELLKKKTVVNNVTIYIGLLGSKFKAEKNYSYFKC